VCLDEVTGSQGAAETQFAGEYGCGNDAGQLASVVAGICWVGPSDAEEV